MGYLKLELFSCITFLLIGVILYFTRKLKTQKSKDAIYIFFSLLTLFFHYIALLFEWIKNEPLIIENAYYLPVYPCNIIMWINFILIFLIPFKGKIFETLAGVSVFLGLPCGVLGLCLNFNFLTDPNFLDIYSLKGLLSHATMIFCSVYLIAMKYIEIRFFKSLFSCIIGSFIFVLCGLFTRYMLKRLGLDPVNSMYFEPPFENYPFIRFTSMCSFGLTCIALFFHIYEEKTLPKEKRWYYPLIKNINNKNEV